MNDCIIANQEGAPKPAGRSGRARTSKIARLPHSVREALNERLRDGLPCAEILPWLNGLPEVREILQKRFAGAAITQDNISRWQHGGFAGWLEYQQAREAMSIISLAGQKISGAERDAMTEHLALVVKSRMVLELRKFDQLPEGSAKSAAWKDLVWSLVLVRRSEFYAGKLKLERDKLPLRKEAKKSAECIQQQKEQFRQALGLNGPNWNNFTKEWEGEGADEMREEEEVERLVREELRRRRALAAAPPTAESVGNTALTAHQS